MQPRSKRSLYAKRGSRRSRLIPQGYAAFHGEKNMKLLCASVTVLCLIVTGAILNERAEEARERAEIGALAMTCYYGCDMAQGEKTDCLFPIELDLDTPETRLYIYSIDPDACFARKYDDYWSTWNWSPVSPLPPSRTPVFSAYAAEIDYL